MRRSFPIVVLALACLAVLAPATAEAKGGGKQALTVPPDWPTSVPVPDGKIKGIQRDITGAISLSVTTKGGVLATIDTVDRLYTAAGFQLDPDSKNPRYLTRADHTVAVYYRPHDFQPDKTDLVVVETAVPRYLAPTATSGPARAV